MCISINYVHEKGSIKPETLLLLVFSIAIVLDRLYTPQNYQGYSTVAKPARQFGRAMQI